MIKNFFFSICGSDLWNPETVYSKNPDFTFCFQNTFLLWFPCGLLWLITPLWIYMLTRQTSSRLGFSWKFILKNIFTLLLIAIEVFNLSQAVINGKEHPVYFITPSILIISYILALFLINFERKNGLKTSTLMFVFWSLLTLVSIITFRSKILNYLNEDFNLISMISFYLFFGLILFNSILSVFSEKEKKKQIYIRNNEYSTEKVITKEWPENDRSLLSKLSFWWINELIKIGFKRELIREDLWNIEITETSEQVSKRLEDEWNHKAEEYLRLIRESPELEKISKPPKKKTKKNGKKEEEINLNEENNQTIESNRDTKVKPIKKPSFGFCLCKVFCGKFIGGAFLKLVQDLLLFAGPLLLDKLLSFIKDRNQNILVGLFYTILLFLTSTIQSFALQHYFQRMFIVGTRIRTSVMNIVFKKSLKLSTSARKLATVGEMTNLIAVDAQSFAELTTYLNVIWSAPLQITISIAMLWRYIGVSSLIGSAMMVLFIPLNILVGNKSKKLQLVKMKHQDSRIKMMNEILNGIKILKLYGWELSFREIIGKIRNNELKYLKKIGVLNLMSTFLWSCAPLIVSIVSFGSYVLLEDEPLDASKAFVSLSLFNIMRFPMTVLPGIIAGLISTNVSLTRIRNFLLRQEINDNDTTFVDIPGVAVKLENVHLGWNTKETYLKNINLEIPKGKLIAIVGEVGNGKSSLLSGILGEMHKLNQGLINLNGSTAYVAQQAWIQNATVKENILFGKPLNELFYSKIIQACCLTSDFEIMPAGDSTEIGEKGINLSGGQKQRISLARSLYSNADIYFLDDPLSAVDSHVGKSIFDQVIGPKGMLKEKTRLFVTNSLSFLPEVDQILMIENGEIIEKGNYEDLLKIKNGSFSKFIKVYLESKESANNKDEEEMTDQTFINSPIKEKEASILTRSNSKSTEKSEAKEVSNNDTSKAGEKIIVKEKIETGNVKLKIIKIYFKACSFLLISISIFAFLLSNFASVGSNLWLGAWSNDAKSIKNESFAENQSHHEHVENKSLYRLSIYALLGTIQSIISMSSDVIFLFMFLNGAKLLHDRMLYSVLRSPMEFFESTPTGRIINRFSKDVEATEKSIPESFKSLLRCLFHVLFTIIVISSSTPYFLICLIPLIIIYYMIQRYFVASMRQLKRLESASKSPIFSHFSETLTGISTIRAYKIQNRFVKMMENRIDENLLFYFPNQMSNRWLALRLELLGNLITVFAALFAVLARNSISAGIAGLSITYSLNVSQTLNWLVRMSAEFETYITSVERIDEYCNIQQESEWTNESKPNEEWPNQGHIIFDDYSVKYRKELENVLRNVNANILPGEKIGIVGRTGAGKSSLTLGLFRILEQSTGKIMIDNIDIKTIGLHDLRQKLTIIPQDPVLFSGTLKINLDPFGKYSDEKIWEALEHAHLMQFVTGLDKKLDFVCSEGGENLSVGQRQLVCLARALLRKTKILILDEATASVDPNTDELIQKTIRSEFADCTILTIAHRLNTIMDSSRILVFDKGKIIEFDAPQSLLSNKNSVFFSMAKDAGIV